MKRFLLPSILILEILLFAWLSNAPFHSFSQTTHYFKGFLIDLFIQSAPILILSFGMTLVLSSAGIDLSVGSMTALIACVLSTFAPGLGFWWIALPCGMGLGLLLGCFNGVLIAKADVPPIIATLGSMIFFRGLCFVVMGDLESSTFLDVPGYRYVGEFWGVLLLVTLLYLMLGLGFGRSRIKEEIFLMGGNRVAARYAGIPLDRRTIQVYGAMGILSFLAAATFTSRNGSVSGSSLTGLELQVIVAVVLGGTPVQGGKGSLWGTFFGVLIVAALDEGLRGAAGWGERHLPFKISHLEHVFLGTLLVAGVWLNEHWKTHPPIAAHPPLIPPTRRIRTPDLVE